MWTSYGHYVRVLPWPTGSRFYRSPGMIWIKPLLEVAGFQEGWTRATALLRQADGMAEVIAWRMGVRDERHVVPN